MEEGKANLVNAATAAKGKAAEVVQEAQKPLAETTSVAYENLYHAKNQAQDNGVENAKAKFESQSFSTSKPGQTSSSNHRISEAVALGPGAVIPAKVCRRNQLPNNLKLNTPQKANLVINRRTKVAYCNCAKSLH